MKVFVTGPNGFIGRSIVTELLAHRHTVLALARSDESEKAIKAANPSVEVVRGSLLDLDILTASSKASDGVIHVAFDHDFSHYEASGKQDLDAVQAIGDALVGTNKPFVNSSANMTLKSGQLHSEDAPASDEGAAIARVKPERLTLSFADKGVRSIIIRPGPVVHGPTDKLIAPYLIHIARTTGVSHYLDEGKNRWSSVHVKDLARLYRLALEKGPAGSTLNGVADGDEAIVQKDLAELIGRKLGVPVSSLPSSKAEEHFGPLSIFVKHDAPSTNAITKQKTGWAPTEISFFEDLENGEYFKA